MNDVTALCKEEPSLLTRFNRVRKFSHEIRSSLYHITHACNLRCQGCWFFAHDFDKKTGSDVKDLTSWRNFVISERKRGINLAILIGGEPSLFLERIHIFAEEMPYVWLSTNGLILIPFKGLENIAISITLFGGGPLDDELRGIRPNGQRTQGLFSTALHNYKNDPRAFFVFAVTGQSTPYIEDVVNQIGENGNRVIINYYYTDNPIGVDKNNLESPLQEQLLDKLLEIRAKYSHVMSSHPYYIRTLITGSSHWDTWGYKVCPSVSSVRWTPLSRHIFIVS